MSDAADKPRVSLAIVGKKKNKKGSAAGGAKKQPPSADVRDAFATHEETPAVAASSDDLKPKEPLVIPSVPNKFGIARQKKNINKQELSKADEEAIRALQAQAERVVSSGDNGSRSNKEIVIQASKDSFQRETQQFRADLEDLPDALDSEDYTRSVPIAEFGAAMLRGMGWKDPTPTKKKEKSVDDEVMPRPHRLGLGAIPKMEEPPSRKRPLRPDQVKQRKRLEEQQKEFAAERERQLAMDKQRTLQNGSLVQLRSGSRAKIIQLVGVPGLNMVKVWIENDPQASIVKRGEIEGLLSRTELADCPYQDTSLMQNNPRRDSSKAEKDDDDDDRDRKRDDDDRKRDRKEKRRRVEDKRGKDRSPKRSREDSHSSRRMTWIIPNIRVRVVTEKLGRRYFKEKGTVVDVTTKGATLRLDKSGVVLDRVPEDYLETALPKPGGKAIVLVGRHKYAKGQLLERDSKRGKGAIQIFEDMSVLNLSLDDMAEFVGSLDDDIA